MVTDPSLTAQTYEEINLKPRVCFQNRPAEHDSGNIGDFAFSGCPAYGVHIGEQGAVSGNKVNMDESHSGTDEQVVSSAHEMVRTESYEDMYMSGDGENESNEDDGKN